MSPWKAGSELANQFPVVVKPASPLSITTAAAVPTTVKLNGFSSPSLLPNEIEPPNVPAEGAVNWMVKVVCAPRGRTVVPKPAFTWNPGGTLIGPLNTRSALPTFRTVNARLTGTPG